MHTFYQKYSFLCLFILSFLGVNAQSYNTNFKEGDDNWIGAYMGYPSRAEDAYELKILWSKIPRVGLDERYGLLFSGKNYSGELFLFAYKKISGLKPNSTYQIIFNASLYTDFYGKDDEHLVFKVGSLSKQPLTFETRMVECNFSKGECGRNSRNLMSLGEITTKRPTSEYQPILLYNYQQPFIGTTNKEGDLWLIIGVEPTESLRLMPDVYVNTLRVLLKYRGEIKTPSIASTHINIIYTPQNQSLYFESEFDYDMEDLSIYTEEGHLVRNILFTNSFMDHSINVSDLFPGEYKLMFNLIDGRVIYRDLLIE